MKTFKEFITSDVENLNEGIVYKTITQLARQKFAKGGDMWSLPKEDGAKMMSWMDSDEARKEAAEVIAKKVGGKVNQVKANEIHIGLANNSTMVITDARGYETNIRVTLFISRDSDKTLDDLTKVIKSAKII